MAAVLHWGEDPLPLIATALVLYTITFTVTLAVNVPLNDALKAAGEPEAIADIAGTRRAFAANRWTRWNLVRAVTSTAAFGCLATALML